MILRNSVCDTEILCLWYWDFSHCDLGRSPARPAQARPTQLHIHLQVQLRLGLHNCTYIYKSSSGWAYTIAHTSTSPAQAGPTQLRIHLQVQLRLGLHNCTYIYKSSSGWAYTIAHTSTSPAQAGPTQLHVHLQVQLRLGLHNCTYKSSSGWAYTIAHTSTRTSRPDFSQKPNITITQNASSVSQMSRWCALECKSHSVLLLSGAECGLYPVYPSQDSYRSM